MTKKELDKWYLLYRQHKIKVAGYFMDNSDYIELVRLNHLVMELCHEVHNENMLAKK